MIEVEAIAPGYYGTRRRIGAVFSIADEKDFSANWMVKVKPAKAEKVVEVEVEQTETKAKKKTKRK